MNRTKPTGNAPRDLLRQAEKAAERGEVEQAMKLFETCIRHYLSHQMPFKALAAAKDAKTALGPLPRLWELLIRLYQSMGLHGDAQQEYDACCRDLRKDQIPFLAGLPREAFLDLLGVIRLVPARRGERIVRQDEPGEDIYVVLSGAFETIRDNAVVSTLKAGDLFGELGFFYHDRRSATVRAATKATLIRIPADDLRKVAQRYASLRESLEQLYHERTLKKAQEDLTTDPLLDLYQDHLFSVRFLKGEEIPFDHTDDVTIVKHGIVEVDYDGAGGPRQKRFLKPGSIIRNFSGIARANTDVEVLRARIDLLGKD